jgi:hypothetical protein
MRTVLFFESLNCLYFSSVKRALMSEGLFLTSCLKLLVKLSKFSLRHLVLILDQYNLGRFLLVLTY